MAQIVIGDHARHHGFADRDRANTDARIVSAGRDDLRVMPVAIDGAAGSEDGRRRLDGETRDNRLTGRNPAHHAAGMVGKKYWLAVISHAHFVAVFFTGKLSSG